MSPTATFAKRFAVIRRKEQYSLLLLDTFDNSGNSHINIDHRIIESVNNCCCTKRIRRRIIRHMASAIFYHNE